MSNVAVSSQIDGIIEAVSPGERFSRRGFIPVDLQTHGKFKLQIYRGYLAFNSRIVHLSQTNHCLSFSSILTSPAACAILA